MVIYFKLLQKYFSSSYKKVHNFLRKINISGNNGDNLQKNHTENSLDLEMRNATVNGKAKS